MKNVIAWMKTNPISVAAFALMVVSLAAIGYFMFVANPALQTRAEAAASSKLTEVKRFTRQPIDVPPANADDPPESRSVVINPAVIEVLGGIYGDLNRESENIFASALAINQAGHEPMMNGLFPGTPNDMKFRARTVYGQLLSAMVGTEAWAAEVAQNTGIAMPYLNARPPVEREYLQSLLDQQMDAMQRGDSLAGGINEARLNQQKKEQQRELINELLRHAQGINIYADPELGDMLDPKPSFPLQVASLGSSAQSPTPSQLWEGQLELWILQDLIRAIALANDVANEREHLDVDGQPVASSVLNAPVKRLLRAEVLPGYVGLHSLGGVDSISATTTTTTTTGNRGSSRGSAATVGGVGGAAGYPPPAGGMTDQPRETKLSENFVFGPTGRSSNGLYDVRHARLLAHVDYQRLPELLNAIGQVNLMSVINLRITSLDEYELLNELYMYGQGDVVEVEMIIETLWLREWTAKLMPDDTKVYVGLKAPPAEATLPGGGYPGEGYPGGGYPGGGYPGGGYPGGQPGGGYQ
ncbi:MAG: hypothetical protein AAF086_03820 [Planctomycetota bacterium]